MKFNQLVIATTLSVLFFSCEKQSTEGVNEQEPVAQGTLTELNFQSLVGEKAPKNLVYTPFRKGNTEIPLIKSTETVVANEEGTVVVNQDINYFYGNDDYLERKETTLNVVLEGEEQQVNVTSIFEYDDQENLIRVTTTSDAPEEEAGFQSEGVKEYSYEDNDLVEARFFSEEGELESTQTFEKGRFNLVRSISVTNIGNEFLNFEEDYFFRFGFVNKSIRRTNSDLGITRDFFHTFRVNNPFEGAEEDPILPEARAFNFGMREVFSDGTSDVLLIALNGFVNKDRYPVEVNFKQVVAAAVFGDEEFPASTTFISTKYSYNE